MCKFTKQCLLLMAFVMSSAIVLGQGISAEERALMDNPPRVTIEADAQTQPMPQERATAPKGIYNPDGNRALTNILLDVTVDYFYSEASYNVWDYVGGAYYWATDQTFSSSYENQQHVLPLEEGDGFDVDCWDTWGDGGIEGEVANDDTGWPITSWGSGDYGSYGAFYFVAGPGTQPAQVDVFPFWATFDDGNIPPEFVTTVGNYAGLRTDADAAESGPYGLLFEGYTSSGWGSTPYSYSSAFSSTKSSHFATVDITIVPSGGPGQLSMSFDLQQGYSFNSNYCWFRTLLNGVELEDDMGNYYWQPSSHNDPWVEHFFDLTPWQGDPNFTVTLQSSCKYYENYYQQGDVVHVDNIHIWYELPPGDLEGYTFNGDGLIVVGATVAIEEVGQTTSGSDGYYFIGNIPVGTHEVLAWKDGYNVVSYMVDIFTQQTTTQDIILTQPTMIINPLQLNETLNPNELLTTSLGILNTGDGPLYWAANIVYTSDAVLLGEKPRQEMPDAASEYSPMHREIKNNSASRDLWDTQFQFPCGDASGEAGVESDGNYIYTTKWNAGSGTFFRYDLDGTFLGSFVISGCQDIRDLAYDGQYFYGSNAGTTVWEMDFDGEVLNGQINAPVATRAIAYDAEYDGFWANNWSTDITLYDRDGTTLNSFGVGTFGSYYGFAWDDQLTGDPYLYGFSQDGSGAVIVEMDATSGAETGVTYDASGFSTTGSGIAGGLAICSGIVPDYRTMLGIIQNETIFGLEFGAGGIAGGWLSLGQYEGNVGPNGGSFNLPVYFDASGFEAGDYVTADVIFTSVPDVGTITIPCSMTVIGDALTPPENLEVELVDDVNGYVDLEWEWYGDATFQYFRIERDGIYVGSTTELEYTDQLPDYGEYCYEVKAVYDEGMTAPAGPECVSWDNPGLFIDPDALTAEVWVNHQVTVYTTIENTGIGTLTYVFPEYDNTNQFECEHTVAMYDDYGDGWNGGQLDVYVDGVLVLNNITLSSGSGPGYAYFNAETGQEITTTFSCGSWCYECSYEIYDGEGNLIGQDGMGGVNPTGIPAGTCYANCTPPSFILDVNPSSGYLFEGETQEIAITYDATGFPPGTYTEWLDLESNDPDHLTDSIHNTMIVTQPAMYEGSVTDANTGVPIAGAMVSANQFNTVTDDNGNYSLYVDEGTYDVNFDKVGYQTYIEFDTFAMAGIVTPLDVMLYESLYAPGWVTATPNYPDDTECLVEWSIPWGAYEIVYDDGSADDFLVYSVASNAHAVKFTPAGYPAIVTGGKVYVGDGSFPIGADFLGSTFGIAVLDDDGNDGMPGAIIDSIEVVVDNYGWINFDGLYANFEDGDFYLAMYQGSIPPNAAPIGIDQSMPTYYRSYTYIGGDPGMWSLSAYQDFMIRAVVNGPQTGDDLVTSPEYKQPPKAIYYDKYIATGKPSGIPGYVKSGEITPRPDIAVESDRDATGYKVARLSNFDPNGSPLSGDTNVLQNNTSNLSYMDNAWGGLPEGWYAYGVAARYNQGGNVWSNYAVSNIVGHLKQVAVTVNVTTTDGSVADSVEIILAGLDYPYDVYTHFTDETATVTFDPVWKGYYDLMVYKPGYDSANFYNQFINSDRTFDIVLGEKRYPPYNLYVDPLTSIATWNAPRITALKEDFEGEMFPPAGWTSSTNSCGWFRTDDGSSDSWTIPAWDSYYACANDDACGSDEDGSVDYLITPPMDLRETGGYSLKFDQFFDGAFGQSAIVEYSLDGGATWEVLQNMSPTAGSWTHEEIDLSQWSNDWNIPAFWIAFHADDNGEWASGWAIDNVEVSVGSDGDWPPMGYHVFLDDAFVVEVQEETYQYLNLQYGVEYTASVGALYTSGLSEKDYYTFMSEWLYPPENLVAANYDNAVHLIWEPPCAPWFDVLSVQPRMEQPNVNSEYSPLLIDVKNNYPGNREFWDTQFEYPCGDASGEAGVESDGNYIYTSKWNAGNGTFFRYELDGTFLGSFVISGPADVRDLAYDPGEDLFWGSNASTSLWGMNFNDEVLEETVNAPVATRAVAYDEDFEGFWANNWDTQITLYDKDGVTLNSFPTGSYGSIYGFAWDDQEIDGAPYLYAFSQAGSGAIIAQYEIASGAETGVTYDAIGFSTTGTGIAGGLAIQGGIVPDTKTMVGIIQNETIFGLEFGAGGPPTQCTTPDNVIGFNVYRDEEFVDYVEYFGEDQVSYWDYNLWPQCYDYTVTAVYDLSPYGFFGQEGESMIEGPFNICVSYGFPLPFFEDWESGTFTEKDWEVQCDNWTINTILGNPDHCAEFQWDPVQENYDCGLVTYPILGNWVEDGEIYCDFDLKIDDRFDTVETEKMIVRVWADGEWTDKAEFVAMGDADWESYHVKISNPAKGHDFRVGFFAVGESSLNIDAWFIDNVHIYQLCEEPKDLASDKVHETQDMGVVELTWVAPGATEGYWISYNDGTFENAIASTEGGAGLAQMFTPTEYPVTITEIRYFNSSFEQYMQECEIWILAGDGETVLAGPYYYEDGPADDWVTVDVDDLTIEDGTFMVATFNVNAGGPYIGMDDSFYDGSLYFGAIGDFTELGEFGYFYVGSHEVYVEVEVSDNVVVNSVLTAPQASANNQISNVSLSGTSATAPAPASRDLLGYNIWRNDELIETGWPETTYYDTVYEPNQYCYYVSALYDQCESDTLGYVCEDFYTSIGDVASGILNIYPNPTRDNVTVESPIAIERITIMNYVGQVVYDATEVEETTVKLDVSTYESGVYFIKVETAEGLTTERVTVTR